MNDFNDKASLENLRHGNSLDKMAASEASKEKLFEKKRADTQKRDEEKRAHQDARDADNRDFRSSLESKKRTWKVWDLSLIHI